MADLSAYIAAIKKAETEVPKMAAEDMVEDSKTLVVEAMDSWYGSYTPIVYHRTYDLYNGIQAGTNASANGNIFTLIVDSDSVGQHSHDPGEYIFNGAFIQGIHGTSKIAVSTPPPDIYEPQLQILGTVKLSDALDRYLASL